MNTNNILWENYMFDADNQAINPLAKISDVKNVENEYGIKFPSDYLDVAMKHQGQYVDDLCIKVRTMIVGFFNFFTFSEHNGKYGASSTINFIHECMHSDDDRHKLLIPFASSFGNSTFCFDYSESLNNPKIVFYFSDREIDDDAITVLADNFTEFLELLYEDED